MTEKQIYKEVIHKPTLCLMLRGNLQDVSWWRNCQDMDFFFLFAIIRRLNIHWYLGGITFGGSELLLPWAGIQEVGGWSWKRGDIMVSLDCFCFKVYWTFFVCFLTVLNVFRRSSWLFTVILLCKYWKRWAGERWYSARVKNWKSLRWRFKI